MGITFSFTQIQQTKKTNVPTQETTFEQKFGIGLISFKDGMELKFYQNSKDEKPFINLKDYGSIEAAVSRQKTKGLNPLINRAEYGYFIFLCRSNQKGWFEIEIDNKTKKTAWVKKNDGFVFKEWGQFLTEIFGVGLNKNSKIRELPEENAPSLEFHKDASPNVISYKGQWLQVHESFDWVDPPQGYQTKTGWLKWRDGNDFLIRYFLTL